MATAGTTITAGPGRHKVTQQPVLRPQPSGTHRSAHNGLVPQVIATLGHCCFQNHVLILLRITIINRMVQGLS